MEDTTRQDSAVNAVKRSSELDQISNTIEQIASVLDGANMQLQINLDRIRGPVPEDPSSGVAEDTEVPQSALHNIKRQLNALASMANKTDGLADVLTEI